MLDLTFNSDCQCSCLENQVQTSKMEKNTQKLLKLKELNSVEKLNDSCKDPDKNLTDSTCFDYYLTLDFYKLNIKNKRKKHNRFSIFHSNIFSLQGHFLKMK